jgi:hypothetical protein
MQSNRTLVFNVATLVFILLSLIGGLIVAWLLVTPPPPREGVVLPTVFALPTSTATDSRPTLPPSFTPTFTPSPTPTFTPTFTLTAAPSATITFTPTITDTPSDTDTPAATSTSFPTPTSSIPTATLEPSLSPFPFQLQEPVVFSANASNSLGCNWQGIGGQVLNNDGTARTDMNVVVFDSTNTFSQVVQANSNTLYGTGGWEVQVDTIINNRLYFVELRTRDNVVVSDRISVQFPSNCTQNLALVRLIRVR